MFNLKNNLRTNDQYAQLYRELTGRITQNQSLTPVESAYYEEWANTCLDPEPSPELIQLYNQIQAQR